MKLTVNLPRTPPSLIKSVRCNGKDYPVAFPQATPSFIEIIQTMEVAKEHQKMIAILSKNSNELDSIQQFYEVQETCLHYFNTKIELNTSDIVVTILSQPDKALKQLDKLKFVDFLSVLKQGYDSLSVKLHAKLSRRIKKYLSDSRRSEAEQKQIRQLINLIKENSSEEDEAKSQPVFLRSIEKVDNITLPVPIQRQKKNIANPFKKQKGYESEQEKSPQISSNREEKPEKSAPQSEPAQSPAIEGKNFKEEKELKSTKPFHKNQKKVEDDWQDIKEEKENRRRAKNMMKKHLKNDRQKSEELPDEAFDEERSQPIAKESKSRRDKNRNEGQGKKMFGNYKEKPQRDLRVLLGINGDTDDGWRERNRVSIIPQYENKAPTKVQKNRWDNKVQSQASSEKSAKPTLIKQESNQLKVVIEQKKEIKVDNLELKKSEVIKIEAKQKSLTRIFIYPTDGKTFTLQSNQSYNLLVNKLFWIKLEPDKVIIQKVGPDASGFLRACKFKSSEDYLLEAEDLTLSLGGMSNLEDGGIKFGSPLIKDFTQNDSQWFKVRDLQVFGYV